MITPTSLPELSHFPVMLEEVIKICSPKKNDILIDCTFGGGGFSKKFLKSSNAKVIAIDRDKFILKISKELKKKYPDRFNFHLKKFSEVNKILTNKFADFIIFDLGLSSIQLDNLNRGFSYNSKDTIDMSMGLTNISAVEVINSFSEQKIKSILKVLGEEHEASRIAKNIIKTRTIKKITKVDHLVEIIKKSKKNLYSSKINPSTKTFQAFRIFVNKEITELINGIINATKILKPGGKLVTISFHSIEDRIIKYFFTNYSPNKSKPSRYFPEIENLNNLLFDKYKNKIYKASNKEIIKNPPSRSAKLRYAIRNKNRFIYPKELIEKFKTYLDLESLND